MSSIKWKPEWVAAAIKIIGSDGHTIFKVEPFIEAGIPEELLPIETLKSDRSDPKSTIFGPDGKVLDDLVGVYGLRVTDRIVSALGLKVRSCMGRGFQAQANYGAIKAWLESEGVEITS